jgi:hypothetical protein
MNTKASYYTDKANAEFNAGFTTKARKIIKKGVFRDPL